MSTLIKNVIAIFGVFVICGAVDAKTEIKIVCEGYIKRIDNVFGRSEPEYETTSYTIIEDSIKNMNCSVRNANKIICETHHVGKNEGFGDFKISLILDRVAGTVDERTESESPINDFLKQFPNVSQFINGQLTYQRIEVFNGKCKKAEQKF